MALEHLFDAELEYQPGMGPLVAAGEGDLIGSGDGTVSGRTLAGILRWTLFEQTGELVCAMSPTLRIETNDGAEIRARVAASRPGTEQRRANGGSRRPCASAPTTPATPGWMACLGSGGEFDAARHRARYRAFLQRNDDAKENA